MPATAKAKKEATELDGVEIREDLSSSGRQFRYGRDAVDTLEQTFIALPHDIQLARFAEGSIGVVGDCYVLYAVALMGAATRETIASFLRAIAKVNKELSIPDFSDRNAAINRLKTLVNSGLIYQYKYVLEPQDKNEEPKTTSLFSITENGIQLVNQKLGKHLIVNQWFQAKPLPELMGWASSAYVAAAIANQQGFHEFRQGVYKTKSVGTVMLPPIVKTELETLKDHPGYIAIIPAFLHFDEMRQTKNDYTDMCYRFTNIVSQYLYYVDLKKHYGRVVVVVEDNDDLVNAASWIQKAGTMKEDYDRIFFTGEGAIKKTGSLFGNFLRMKESGEQGGFVLIPADPDFVRQY